MHAKGSIAVSLVGASAWRCPVTSRLPRPRLEEDLRGARFAHVAQIACFICITVGLPAVMYLDQALQTPTTPAFAKYTPRVFDIPPATTLLLFGLAVLTVTWLALSWFGVPRIDFREWLVVIMQTVGFSSLVLAGGWLDGDAAENIWRWAFLFSWQFAYVVCGVLTVHWLNRGEASRTIRMHYPTEHWLVLLLGPPLIVPLALFLISVFLAGAVVCDIALVGLLLAFCLISAFFLRPPPSKRCYRFRNGRPVTDRE